KACPSSHHHEKRAKRRRKRDCRVTQSKYLTPLKTKIQKMKLHLRMITGSIKEDRPISGPSPTGGSSPAPSGVRMSSGLDPVHHSLDALRVVLRRTKLLDPNPREVAEAYFVLMQDSRLCQSRLLVHVWYETLRLVVDLLEVEEGPLP